MRYDTFGKFGAAALVALVLPGIAGRARAQDPAVNVPGARNAIVYKQLGDNVGWPGVAQTPDGILWVSTTALGHPAVFQSKDGGRTWLWTKADYPENPADKTPDGGSIRVVPDGWKQFPKEQLPEYKKKGYLAQNWTKTTAAYLGSASIVTTTTDGKVSRRRLPGAEDAAVLNLDGTFLTRAGVRLMPIYGYLKKPCTGGNNSYVARSADGGKTWKIVTIAAQINGADGSSVGFNETALAQTPDGTIVALMRSADDQHGNPETAGHLYESTSRDDGATWSAPVQTPIWGYPANLVVLKNGDLLATYGYRRKPYGIRGCLSHDGGKTWDFAHEFVLRGDGFNGALGYPKTFLNADGSLCTVYYFTSADRNMHIEATVWKVPSP